MQKAILAFATLASLAGCQAPAGGLAPQLDSHAITAKQPPPRIVPASQLRHVLSNGSIWGIQLLNHYETHNCIRMYGGTITDSKYWFDGTVNLVGGGEFIQLSPYRRYMFTVPSGQALVINSIDGGIGPLVLNGYQLPTTTYVNGAHRQVYYVFGPDEEVVVRLESVPTEYWQGYEQTKDGRWSRIRSYSTLAISGYTINASALGGITPDKGK